MKKSWMFVALALLAALPGTLQAQTGQRCFDVPGISSCISGRFREFWEQNGGLPVFGYPLTAVTSEQTADGMFLTQYFERNRFELHPEKAAPYDVLLGRLGDDRLRQQGRDWHDFGPTTAMTGCRFFPQTKHNICDLQAGVGFKQYWESHGLRDPQLGAVERSLALFGLPLSEMTTETNAAGDTVLTQWFERARFEFHLDKPVEFRVLLGLLGTETRQPGPVPTPGPTPPPQTDPHPECAGVAGPEQAIAVPNCAKPGETVTVSGLGFVAGESVDLTLTTPDQPVVGRRLTADQFGVVTVRLNESAGFAPGEYVALLTATADATRRATAPFRVLRP